MRRMVPDNVVTVAAGGIGSSEQVLGRLMDCKDRERIESVLCKNAFFFW